MAVDAPVMPSGIWPAVRSVNIGPVDLLIDPDTMLLALVSRPAVPVWSHIDWHGTVIVRYWSGDVIEGGVTDGECAHCGLVVPRLFQPFRRPVADFIKVKGARVDRAELRAAIETLLARDTYQTEIRGEDDGRRTINAFILESADGVSVEHFREVVMGAVELRIEGIQICDAADKQHRLYGAGGWKPRWLINE